MKRIALICFLYTISSSIFAAVNCTGTSTYDPASTAALPCENAKQAIADAKENLKACMDCGAKGEPAADVCVQDHKNLLNDLKSHLAGCKEQENADKKAADDTQAATDTAAAQ